MIGSTFNWDVFLFYFIKPLLCTELVLVGQTFPGRSFQSEAFFAFRTDELPLGLFAIRSHFAEKRFLVELFNLSDIVSEFFEKEAIKRFFSNDTRFFLKLLEVLV
jgi:hypothetical protein